MTQYIAFAKIGEEQTERSWVEDFKVDSKETAADEVKEVIDMFNRTLKPGEKPRKYVQLMRVEEKEISDPNEDDDEYCEDSYEMEDDDYEHDF